MRTIPKERILRVNCPGYGVETNFNLGNAKPLNNYSAIIVNPTSIAHLFDKDPELVRRIDTSLAEGHTTYKLDDDLILRNIAAEAESRILELSDFLTQGGFLVYFLCRPFVLKSPGVSVDNYYWLETLAPDQPLEQNVRHMSAVAQGRLVEVTEKGEQSDLAPYLRQPGLEWSTIIRDDFLTDGYHLLATAGPNKCIAGQLYIMQSNGRVAFLPAPFSPDFDRTLIDCLNRWYSAKELSPEELEAERREAEALAAAEDQAPVAVPSQGPQFFDRDQGEPDQAIFQTQPEDSISPEPEAEPQIYGAPEPVAEQPVASVESPPAASPAAPPVEAEKPATQEIDLSIFAKTARQLVQKSSEDTLTEVTNPLPPPAPEPAPIPQADPAPVLVPEASHSDLINATDAVDTSIAGKIASDLIQESLQLDPPQQNIAPPPVEEHQVPDIESQQQQQPVHAEKEQEIATQTNGEVTVTNNENLQDEQARKLKAMEALKELQLSHPAAAPAAPTPAPAAAPQPTPPGHAVPPQAPPAAAAPAPAPAPAPQPVQHNPGNNQAQEAKPLLNTLFKQAEPASQAPPPQAPRQTNHVDLPVPDWCKSFSFSYLDDLRQEQTALSEQLQSVQAKLNTVESRIASVDQLKQALLAGEPGILIDACNTVLSRLGWTVRKSDRVGNEILLSNVEHPEGLARVVRSDDQCGRTEVAQLAESAISFWDEHEIEPKGVLIACTWATQSPSQRTQPDFSDSLRKFAEKKNLCLMTAMQLLGIYRDIELGATSPDVVRKQILETSGQLSGYEVEKGVVQAGAAV